MAVIGIDLGTTNSLVAYWKDGQANIIPNPLNNNLTPSVVSVDENGSILVGEIAKERLITHPGKTAANFKRFMGTEKKYYLGKYTFTPEDLSAFILKSLKENAENYLGEEVKEAVISVPAYFNDAQRKATKRAGMLAGLKVERLITEPTAAALAYGLNDENDETQFLIFDLGGGTFDVSILELFDGIMEVKSIAGDNFLGGEDFNHELVNYFLYLKDLDIHKLENKDSKIVSEIYKQAENCKKTLTYSKSATMKVVIEGVVYEAEITREKFEEISRNLILKLRMPIQKAMKDADLTEEDLDAVVLIGGSTRMPFVKSIVSKMFNKLPFSNINPDETVALGAAVQAALKERNSELKEMVLTDVCPYTLGIEIINRNAKSKDSSGYFLPIIERNSPIPISKVEEDLCTVADNQTTINVNIFQGESIHVSDNIRLGTLEVKVPPAPAGTEKLNVRFTYDINGLLEVEVKILSTGEIKSVIIEKSPGILSDDEIEKRLKELEKIKIHPRDQEQNRLIIARGERLYQELLGDKRMFVAKLISEFEGILNTQDMSKINEMAKSITKIFDELENL